MPETSPTCRIFEKDDWIECANPALPGDPEGLCILHSQDQEKDMVAFREAVRARWDQKDSEYHDFRWVFFPGPFNLWEFSKNLEVEKAVDFLSAIFINMASFSRATFKKGANFSRATFKEWAFFDEVIFFDEVNFLEATFRKKAFFFEATFSKGADFSKAIFEGQAVFSMATFSEGADFSEAIFKQLAEFYLASITGRLVFRALNQPQEDKQAQQFISVFESLQLSPGAVLRFQNLSLGQVFFRDTDLRHAEFHHTQWHPFRGRQAIYDEVLLRQEEKENPWFWTWFCFYAPYADPPSPWGDSYGEVERLYRNLKLNYEEAGDYKNAGDFHYGEMEMHRRASKWRWFPFYWYNLYWALSGYGERPSRALGWLVVFLLALPLLVWGFGLDRVTGGTTPGFLDTFTYIFEKATFQRPPLLSNLSLFGRFISNLSLLIIPGQAALFLLALRNRLGRRR